MAAVRSRRGPSFDDWVAARGPALLRLAVALTGSVADAEDVVQDALSRALPRWERIARVEDVEAYVRRMVVNAHTSRWRRFRRRETPVAEPAVHGRVDGPESLLPVDDRARIWAACRALPEAQRTAVVLRYYEQLDYAEIADLTGYARGRCAPGCHGVSLLCGPSWGRRSIVADFEERVGKALTSYVDEVRAADGLAAGARARRGRRTRRRVVGAGVVVLALAVGLPLAVAGLGGGADHAAPAHPVRVLDVADDGWQTVRLDDTEVDIPPGWVEVDRSTCPRGEDYVPPGGDHCGGVLGLRFDYSANADYFYGPGVRSRSASRGFAAAPWSGYVRGGSWNVYVGADERSVVSRVLGSVRAVEGSPGPAETTRQEEWHGLTVEVPVAWFAQAAPCVRDATPGDPAIEFPAAGARANCTLVSQGYGARFFDAAESDFISPLRSGHVIASDPDRGEPADAWVGQVSGPTRQGYPGVFVVAPDRATVQQVLDSARFLRPKR